MLCTVRFSHAGHFPCAFLLPNQIFNLISSRRINDEYNFFEGLARSHLFLIILAIIVICQVRQMATQADVVPAPVLAQSQWEYSLCALPRIALFLRPSQLNWSGGLTTVASSQQTQVSTKYVMLWLAQSVSYFGYGSPFLASGFGI